MKKLMAVRTLAAVLTLFAMAGSTIGGNVPAEAATAVEIVDGEASVVGTGPWLAKIVCAGCLGTILFLGGSSILGLIAITVAAPGPVGLCAGMCTVGFS